MYDKSLVIEILTQIENAIKITMQRFEVVDSVDYFTNTPQGMEKLDSICMQLIAIGESLKNIDKITRFIRCYCYIYFFNIGFIWKIIQIKLKRFN